MDVLVKMRHVNASVKLGNGELLSTVCDASFDLYRGQTYAIIGASGSGKTSLISIIGLLNSEYSGEYYYHQRLVSSLSDAQRSHMRADNIGFVFQNYSLIRHLNVRDNVALALAYMHNHWSAKQRRKAVEDILDSVGLLKRAEDYPSTLSGGEQQRVALARAMVTNPELLICDEPTGALDTKTGARMLSLLQDVVHYRQTTLILVTHDNRIAQSCSVQLTMNQGVISHV